MWKVIINLFISIVLPKSNQYLTKHQQLHFMRCEEKLSPEDKKVEFIVNNLIAFI